ncbi:MAG TPA: hypothetical protein PK926_10960 [Spirochaetota bacterium]|nr:hypothetical protein [Spirochaetota bacterium]HPI88430.1 hypothetical protein [Spirochaetota bacterium]HPR48793.1 hypothetical protein [Spirochaetota bacterium]
MTLLNDTDIDSVVEGKVFKISNIRPNKLFTADSGIVLYKIGSLKPQKLDEVVGRIVAILKG